MSKASGSIDLKSMSAAAKTATNYMEFDSTNGLRIARSSPSTATSNLIQITAGDNPVINIIKDSTNKAAIDADGMKVYKGDASNPVAQFGTIFYVGRNKEFYLDSQNMQFLTPNGNGLGFECRNIEGETSTSVTEQILNSYICDGTETVVKLSGISFLSEYDNTNTFYKYNDVVKYFNSSTAIFYGGDAPKEIIAEISSAAVSGFSDGDEIIFYQQYPASTTIYYPYMSLLSKRSNGGIGQYSLTVGLNNVASGYISYAEGNDTRALGYISHAEGYKTTTGTVSLGGGKYAHAEGNETIAYADSSHVEGYKTIAGVSGQSKGAYSHAEGSYTITTGNSSHAEGSNTQAISYCAHAEGGETIAGNTSTINGWYAHAEGYLTVASGGSAHSEGSQSIASGSDSHAQNFYTIASKAAQTALGTLNIEDTSTTTTHPSGDTDYGQYAVIIGNGTSDLNKSNALTVAWNGNLWTAGNIRATTESTTITIPAANKFTVYTGSPYTTNTNIKLRRFGNVVTITGMVKPKETIAGSDNEYTICSIPTAYSSWCPPQVIVQIMQGSAQYKWCLKINTSGTVTFSRYSGTTSYAQVTTSTWLPFHATWIVDS